ncbi:SigB/SigF/SigG family RNA polymerase sigma factor [Umezawaea sp. Da 62-37]|nr:SigB/SigF/SigG family RNA polymerase sigma factor [Umezawaea sp. Da 62-37]WNV91827.1 SigB/SigF/SigG family RNA polymerase sigma factor [Umezawaea sp. Da 62-37]
MEPVFRELAATDPRRPRFNELRDLLVTSHLPVAEHIAERFADRGENAEDLRQVAAVGLINAVDRFDVGRGIEFLAFAVPTITGEIRRYFRDLCWTVRVPRKLKELCLAIDAARTELSDELGRAPTPREVARHLDVSPEEVYEGLHASSAYHLLSLDDLPGEEVDDQLRSDDHELEVAELHHALNPMLRGLPKRERRIVVLRFFEDKTQTEIANLVGVSQMHVSRLLAQSLERLRNLLEEE